MIPVYINKRMLKLLRLGVILTNSLLLLMALTQVAKYIWPQLKWIDEYTAEVKLIGTISWVILMVAVYRITMHMFKYDPGPRYNHDNPGLAAALGINVERFGELKTWVNLRVDSTYSFSKFIEVVLSSDHFTPREKVFVCQLMREAIDRNKYEGHVKPLVDELKDLRRRIRDMRFGDENEETEDWWRR